MAAETWVILGGSSAVARAFAHDVAAGGANVVLAGRDTADLERTAGDIAVRYGTNAAVLAFDATAYDSHAAFADAAMAKQRDGSTVNLFLAFARMPEQTAIEADPLGARECIDATFTGATSVLLHLLPHFERQRGGAIIVLGSVAGDRGRRRNYVYGAAKAGLHTFLQGFRQHLHKSGVLVVSVKPGFVDTAMTWGQPGLFLVAEPGAVSAAALKAVERKRQVIYVPGFWRLLMLIIRAIPEGLFKRLSF